MTEHSLWRFSRALHRAINERQPEDLADLLDDEVDWAIYGPIDMFPFFGSRRGKAAVLEVIRQIGENVRVHRFDRESIMLGVDSAASMMRYSLTALDSNKPISLRIAHFAQFRAGRLTNFRVLVGSFDLVFVVNAESEYKTLGDFLKAARANPGKLNIGTIAVGGTQNLGGELFKSLAGLNVQIVPYKNSPDIIVALLRNDVQLMVDFPPATQGQVNDGKLKVLATSSPKRSPLMPNVPTVDEAGVKGYEVISWNGVGMPKDTPKEVIDTMNKAIREVMAMPDVKEQYAKVGVVAAASAPDEFKARLVSDIKKWTDVIEKAGIPKK